MADQIITYEYAYNNFDAYKKKVIPNTKQCMTKAKVIEYINCDESLLNSYTNNRLVPRIKVVGASSSNLPANLNYTYTDQPTILGTNYYNATGNTSEQYSPFSFSSVIRKYTGGTKTTIANAGSLRNIIDDILTLTSAPLASITMKRFPMTINNVIGGEDQIFLLGNRIFTGGELQFIPSSDWINATTPKTASVGFDASLLINTNNYGDVNYFNSNNLYPGGPQFLTRKNYFVNIFDGTEGSGYYRSVVFQPQLMTLKVEFFSYGVSIGTATIDFSNIQL